MIENPNIEYRNPKPYQMTKIINLKQESSLDINYLKFEFVSNFVLRASNLC